MARQAEVLKAILAGGVELRVKESRGTVSVDTELCSIPVGIRELSLLEDAGLVKRGEPRQTKKNTLVFPYICTESGALSAQEGE